MVVQIKKSSGDSPIEENIEDHVRNILLEALTKIENEEQIVSLQLSKKHDKASGPGIILSRDGKEVFNFNDKCPPIPYFENFDNMIIPPQETLVYPNRYIVNVYDDRRANSLPQVLGQFTRKEFLLRILLIVSIQLLYTFAFTYMCIKVEPIGRFVKNNIALFYCVFSVEMIVFFMFFCVDIVRQAYPYNYILLAIFTICSAYILGSVHAHFKTDKLFLIAFGGTMIILFLIGLTAWANLCDCTPLFFLIDMLVITAMVLFLVALMYYWITGSGLIMYMFYCIFLFIVCFSLLHQLQLLLGKGRYSIPTVELILIAFVIYIQSTIIFSILPTVILGPA